MKKNKVEVFEEIARVADGYIGEFAFWDYLKNSTQIELFFQADVMVRSQNKPEWYLVEIKHSEYFKKGGGCPFDGHGLTIWQKNTRLQFQKETGIRVLLVVIEKGYKGRLIYKQFLDVLDSKEYFDTKGRTKCRIYPIKNFVRV